MTNSQPKTQLVFGDADADFLKRLKDDPKAQHVPPLLADVGSATLALVSNPELKIAAIFVGTNLNNPDYVSVIRACARLRRGVPVYLLVREGDAEVTDEQMSDWGLAGVQEIDFSYEELLRKFIPAAELFDPRALIEKGKYAESESSDEERFFPIRASYFLSGSKVLFPLYIRLDSGRFVRILQSGDDFDGERLKRYLDQGVERFYSPREFEADYLAYCDKLNAAIFKSVRLPQDVKLKQAFVYGDQIMGFFERIKGVDMAAVQFAKTYVEHVFQVVNQLDLSKQHRTIAELLKTDAVMDHTIPVVAVASIIGFQLGIESSKSVQILGLAALLHDIGLIGMDIEFRTENEESMTDEQRKRFRTHPMKGSKIIQSLQGIDPAVAHAVLMHHRRRDGSGFPNATGVGLSQMTNFSEIIGLADAYVQFMMNRSVEKDGNMYYAIYQDVVLSPFTTDVRDAFVRQFPTPVAPLT